MNKKLIIGIVAAVIALAVIVVAIIGITGTFGKNDKDSSDGSSNPVSSPVSDNADSNDKVVSDFTVNDKGNAVVEAEKPDSNTIIEVPIMVSENKNGFLAGQFSFTYDANALTYLDYAKGNLFDAYEVVSKSGEVSCIISASGIEDIKGDGKLIVLKFKAKDSAKAGSYEIKVASSTMGTSDEKLVNPKVSGGIITIK